MKLPEIKRILKENKITGRFSHLNKPGFLDIIEAKTEVKKQFAYF